MNQENMTPEQMAALAKQQCIFCQIASGKVASRKVYEDDIVVGVLDINPANPGHVLLITKEHYVVMPQIPDDVVAHIGMVAKGISHALLRAIKAQGTTIFVANGVAAGQRAQHFMLHVIPRIENDGIGIEAPEHQISDADYKKILDAIKPGIAKAFGQEVPEEEVEEEAEEEVTEEDEEKVVEAEEEEPEEEEEKEKKIIEAEEIEEEAEEEVEEEEESLEEAAEKATSAKPKKTKKKKANAKLKKEEPEEEEEKPKPKKKKKKKLTEAEKERMKLDQIANILT